MNKVREHNEYLKLDIGYIFFVSFASGVSFIARPMRLISNDYSIIVLHRIELVVRFC